MHILNLQNRTNLFIPEMVTSRLNLDVSFSILNNVLDVDSTVLLIVKILSKLLVVMLSKLISFSVTGTHESIWSGGSMWAC